MYNTILNPLLLLGTTLMATTPKKKTAKKTTSKPVGPVCGFALFDTNGCNVFEDCTDDLCQFNWFDSKELMAAWLQSKDAVCFRNAYDGDTLYVGYIDLTPMQLVSTTTLEKQPESK